MTDDERIELARAGMKVPEDFTVNGMNKGNCYLLKEEDFPSRKLFNEERFRRAGVVIREWQKTDQYKVAAREMGYLSVKKRDDERRRLSYEKADAAEILLIEKLDSMGAGVSTNEMVASCIDLIAKELAKRGMTQISELKVNELINISNHLLALVKAASSVRRDNNLGKNTIVAQNITVNNNSSKTGGVIGGLEDVIDVEVE